MLLCRVESRLCDIVRDLQIDGQIERAEDLQADPSEESLFPTQAVDHEERADEGRDELDDAVDTRREEASVPCYTDEGKQFRCESGERPTTGPLTRCTKTERQEESIPHFRDETELFQRRPEATTVRHPSLPFELIVYTGQFGYDVRVIFAHVSDSREDSVGIGFTALLDQPPRRFGCPEGK